MATGKTFIFRKARVEDIPAVRAMIQELADFERMSDGPKLTDQDLIRDGGLNGGQEFCHIYVLQLQQDGKQDGQGQENLIIGYAVCFFAYSTWQGKSYFLEDIYVRPEYRGRGAGSCIFREVAAKAKEFGCKRLDFHVLAWNPAAKFYQKLGAIDLTEAEAWHFYRLQGTQFDQLTHLQHANRAANTSSSA